MILNNIDDVSFDDCFMLPAASVGRRHVGFPCKSCQLSGLRQLSRSPLENLKPLLKTLTSSSFNFLLLRVYS